MTNCCDRLHASIVPHYLQKRKVEANKRTKCARYITSIIAVNRQLTYVIVLTSFESTSSCDIMCVNAINANRNFVEARSRDRGDKKRHYVIEQNITCLLYLKSYSRINSIDYLIKNYKIRFTSWNTGTPLSIIVKPLRYVPHTICIWNTMRECWSLVENGEPGKLLHLP